MCLKSTSFSFPDSSLLFAFPWLWLPVYFHVPQNRPAFWIRAYPYIWIPIPTHAGQLLPGRSRYNRYKKYRLNIRWCKHTISIFSYTVRACRELLLIVRLKWRTSTFFWRYFSTRSVPSLSRRVKPFPSYRSTKRSAWRTPTYCSTEVENFNFFFGASPRRRKAPLVEE